MKITRFIYAFLAFMLVNLTFSKLANSRRTGCSCKADEYCDIANACHKRTAKGGACSELANTVNTCAVGTSCKQNPVTKKYRCD